MRRRACIGTTTPLGPRYKGQIFEEWFETNHDDVKASPQPYILISDDTEARRKCADGCVEGTGTARGNTLVETKAYTSTAPPDAEQVARMQYYRANLGKSWTMRGEDKKVFNSRGAPLRRRSGPSNSRCLVGSSSLTVRARNWGVSFGIRPVWTWASPGQSAAHGRGDAGHA